MVERVSSARGLEGLVLQSQPYAEPAWVKYESWVPAADKGMTARAAINVRITTKPFHQFEAVYGVDWERHGQKGSSNDLFQFSEREVEKLLAFLAAPPVRALLRFRIHLLLEPLRLRRRWYQVWRPRNRVLAIRRDWLRTGSIAAVVIGTLLLFAGSGASTDAPESAITPSVFGAVDPPATSSPAPSVTAPGLVQSGRLDDADLRLDDGRLYESRTIAGRAGVPVVVTMRSDDFDTYIVLGTLRDGQFTPLADNDDGIDSGTNSQLTYVPDADGQYVVLFTSYEAGESGAYSFTIE